MTNRPHIYSIKRSKPFKKVFQISRGWQHFKGHFCLLKVTSFYIINWKKGGLACSPLYITHNKFSEVRKICLPEFSINNRHQHCFVHSHSGVYRWGFVFFNCCSLILKFFQCHWKDYKKEIRKLSLKTRKIKNRESIQNNFYNLHRFTIALFLQGDY